MLQSNRIPLSVAVAVAGPVDSAKARVLLMLSPLWSEASSTNEKCPIATPRAQRNMILIRKYQPLSQPLKDTCKNACADVRAWLCKRDLWMEKRRLPM